MWHVSIVTRPAHNELGNFSLPEGGEGDQGKRVILMTMETDIVENDEMFNNHNDSNDNDNYFSNHTTEDKQNNKKPVGTQRRDANSASERELANCRMFL